MVGMGTGRLIVVMLGCVFGAIAALVISAAFDAPVLALAAVVLVLAAFAAKEIWASRGDERGWLLTALALGGALALGFVSQRLFG
jgi:hypothetical protein